MLPLCERKSDEPQEVVQNRTALPQDLEQLFDHAQVILTVYRRHGQKKKKYNQYVCCPNESIECVKRRIELNLGIPAILQRIPAKGTLYSLHFYKWCLCGRSRLSTLFRHRLSDGRDSPKHYFETHKEETERVDKETKREKCLMVGY